MAVEEMQFAMPMVAGYEGFHFTPFQAEKEQAEAFVRATRAEPAEDEAFVRVRAGPEAAIFKAKSKADKVEASVQAKAEKEAAILKTEAEKEEAFVVKAKPEKEAAILKAKPEAEKEGAFVVKAKAEKEEAFAVKANPKTIDRAFMVLAGRRGPGMAEADEMDYMSDETDYDSDEDPDLSYAKFCERFEQCMQVRHAQMPWLKFQSDSSVLKMQEDNKRRQEEVSVVA